jgi:hypothetical protein
MRWLGSTLKISNVKVLFYIVFSYLSISQTAALTLDIGIGGSLGWKVRGSLHGDFEKVAYELEPSTTANPKYAEVKTSHG